MKRFRRIKALLIGILISVLPVSAFADIPPPLYATIASTATVVVKTGSGVFYGVQSLATQITVLTCYDNTALSGTQIYVNTPTLTTLLGAPPNGVQFNTGLTCAIATSIVAPGLLVLYR